MKTFENKSKQELIKALQSLNEEILVLKNRLSEIERIAETKKYADLIIDNSPTILFRRIASEDLQKRRMVYISPNISRFGYDPEDFLSNKIMFRHIVHPDDTGRIVSEIKDYVERGIESYTQVYRIIIKNGDVRWVEDHTSVIDDPDTGIRYHQGIVTDIHRRKMAEEELRKSEEKYRRIVETAGEGFLYMDNNLLVIDANDAYCRMVLRNRKELIGKNLIDMVTDKFRPFLAANRDDLLSRRYYEFETDLIAATGSAVPVLIHGNTLYDDENIVIGNIAFVTDMSEHKKALVLAGQVQKSLLPQAAPIIPGLDISGKNISCDEIGGDYFDFLERQKAPKASLTVAVGDFSGHGVDSALLMTTARAFLLMRSSQPGSIRDIITDMNRHLSKDIFDTGQFMTLFLLTIDMEERHIEWVRAGHEPAWLYDSVEDTFHELKGPGMALGVDDELAYESNKKTGLRKGQILIVGTDGIWEGHNKAGEMFGKNRVQEVIRQNAASSAKAILESVLQEQQLFTQDATSEDDLTLVIAKITD
jgi:sigma-B regulation protein RsbU (phosphoserine phosphatase)